MFLLPVLGLLLGVVLLRVPWLRSTPLGIPCQDVFNSPPRLVKDADGGYVLALSLKPGRPEVDVILQEFGPRGFGWLVRRLPASGPVRAQYAFGKLPNGPVRVAIESTDERQRGIAIRRAAAQFDLASWLRARGWVAPAISPCWGADVRKGHG